jgi:hypothetical protein
MTWQATPDAGTMGIEALLNVIVWTSVAPM